MPSLSPLKLLVFGLDGADYRLTKDWLSAGHLPHLASLARRGCFGPLATIQPPITPAAWTSLLTGKNPGKHGVYSFHRLWTDSDSLLLAPPSRAVSVFRILEAAGLRTGVLNFPWTYPPEPLQGFVVSGVGAPQLDRTSGHPEGIVEDLLAAVGPYDIWPTNVLAEERFDQRVLAQQVKLVTQGALALLRRVPCRALFCASMFPDVVQHSFFGNRSPLTTSGERLADAILHAYERMDAALGFLLGEACDEDTTVLVVSDHGGVSADRLVNLEQLFMDRGYLVRRPVEARSGDALRRGLARPALALWRAAKAALPGFLVKALRGTARKAREELAHGFASLAVDWLWTVAAPWSAYGTIRLNVRGRDPQGIVPPGDYLKVRGEIAEYLASLRDPGDGQPVFSSIRTQEELFHGPYTQEGPDLQLESREWRYIMPTQRHIEAMPLLEVQLEPIARLEKPWGNHGPQGILAMAGPGVAPHAAVMTASLLDVAPTLLALLDAPVPTDMDGRVLAEALTPAARMRIRPGEPLPFEPPPDDRLSAYTEEEREQIEKHLADMGYL